MLNSWFYLFLVGEKSKEREADKAGADLKLQQRVVVQTRAMLRKLNNVIFNEKLRAMTQRWSLGLYLNAASTVSLSLTMH